MGAHPRSAISRLPALRCHGLQDQARISGALYVLRFLARKYEFRDDDERGPLDGVVNATFPTLLQIFQARQGGAVRLCGRCGSRHCRWLRGPHCLCTWRPCLLIWLPAAPQPTDAAGHGDSSSPALSASWLVAALRLIAGRLWGPVIVDLLWVPIWVQMLLAMDSSSPELAELLKLVCKTFW